MFPLMSPDELKALGEDIKKNGMRVPIVFWSENKDTEFAVLDGRNRLDAAELVGVKVFEVREDKAHRTEIRVPHRYLFGSGNFRDVIDGSSATADAYEFVLSANVHRRHLTTAQRIELVEKVLKANPHMSSRRAAKLAGVSPTTGVKARNKLEQSGDVSTVDTSVDTRGRRQPAHKSATRSTVALTKHLSTVDNCARNVRAVVCEVMDAIEKSEWAALFAALHEELNQLETASREDDFHNDL
jgi:hypothetical protein